MTTQTTPRLKNKGRKKKLLRERLRLFSYWQRHHDDMSSKQQNEHKAKLLRCVHEIQRIEAIHG